jgi:hypothetical protein
MIYRRWKEHSWKGFKEVYNHICYLLGDALKRAGGVIFTSYQDKSGPHRAELVKRYLKRKKERIYLGCVFHHPVESIWRAIRRLKLGYKGH